MANPKTPPRTPQTVNIGSNGVISSITASNMMWEGSSTTTSALPTTEHLIKGEMLGVSKIVDTMHRMNSPVDDDDYKDIIKRELLQMLVNELWKTNHVEFTMMKDQAKLQDIYRARICTVPDTQVRILRERGLPK